MPRIRLYTAALPPLRLLRPSRRGNEPPVPSFVLGMSLFRAGFLAGVPPTRLAAEHPPTHPAAPRIAPPWHARATGKLQSLAPARFGHGKAGIDLLQRSPAVGFVAGGSPPPPVRPKPPCAVRSEVYGQD